MQDPTGRTLRSVGLVGRVSRRLGAFLSRNARPSPAPSVRTGLSEDGRYPDFCWRAATEDEVFAGFRRQPEYMEVLGLDPKWGRVYYEALRPEGRAAGLLREAANADLIGDPIRITLPDGLEIAPTTLRYLKVADDLDGLFGSLDGARICEIGGGYGGQCRVLDSMWALRSYTLVDIRPALLLADRFLSYAPLRCPLALRTMNELETETYDLVISNYAFSELVGPVQEAYYERVLAEAARGYLVFNDIGGSALGSGRVTAEELCSRVGGRILPETPLTGRRNQLVVWGTS